MVLLILLFGVAAWYWGPDVLRHSEEWRGAAPPAAPTPEIAERASARFESLLSGGIDEARFSAVELESVVRFALPEYLPQGVTDPSVRLRDGEFTVSLKVAGEILPNIPDLEGVRGFLPDTIPVQLRGRLVPLDEGDAGFLVNRVDAAGIPIPNRFIPALVNVINPHSPGDLPPEIVRISLPEGIRAVRVDGDQIVILGNR